MECRLALCNWNLPRDRIDFFVVFSLFIFHFSFSIFHLSFWDTQSFAKPDQKWNMTNEIRKRPS